VFSLQVLWVGGTWLFFKISMSPLTSNRIGFIKGPDVWRTFFWITGGITVVFAFIVGALIPDNPISAKFITERQKAIAVDRIRADQGGIENKTFKQEQMIECFTDPKTWLSVLFQFFFSIPNGGLTNV
jgi:ACS family allantoate permease-like MFS transporter